MDSRPFILKAPYTPTGDQPRAISDILKNITGGAKKQTLLGVTGSGKTFTMANVIEKLNRPVLVMSHNKTLAAQLYQEFKEFFPENAVHYFVSYYDYYQPEAYLPTTDTYIEKDASINEFIDGLRHASTAALLTRKDTIIVSSVSAIYGLADPKEYRESATVLRAGEKIARTDVLHRLADLQYHRNDVEHLRGTFAVKGDTLDIVPPDGETVVRISFFGNTIEDIHCAPRTVVVPAWTQIPEALIFPAKHFVMSDPRLEEGITRIEMELKGRLAELTKGGKNLEAERLKQRTRFDIQTLRATGYCSGIENYSRHLSLRDAGGRPYTLMDYFPKDLPDGQAGFLTIIDESHISLPQIRGMYAGDRARKTVLVEYGFRLPSALDNRPLMFDEFEAHTNTTVYVSATPSAYERNAGPVVEQLVRPTGLLDPTIEVRRAEGAIDDAVAEIRTRAARGERALLIALTKRNAEDIAGYCAGLGLKVAYIHSDVETLERPEILRGLREGVYDVLVGINLLREGLDLPEVSLVCILDADAEGFLRTATTLTQTAGRASRHPSGHVIFYADRVTDAMRETMEETARRRTFQEAYNNRHGTSPQPITKPLRPTLFSDYKKGTKGLKEAAEKRLASATDTKSKAALRLEVEKEMLEAAEELKFERAAELRDLLERIS